MSAANMALMRTALALDRTLLAWMRTSLTLIGFGFALARYINHIITVDHLNNISHAYPREIGAGLMALGVACLVGGMIEYVVMARKLYPGRRIWSVSLIVCLVLAVMSCVLIGDLLFELNSH